MEGRLPPSVNQTVALPLPRHTFFIRTVCESIEHAGLGHQGGHHSGEETKEGVLLQTVKDKVKILPSNTIYLTNEIGY